MIEYIFLMVVAGFFLIMVNFVLMRMFLSELKEQERRMIEKIADYMENKENARTKTKD
jgi:hypothetical protein